MSAIEDHLGNDALRLNGEIGTPPCRGEIANRRGYPRCAVTVQGPRTDLAALAGIVVAHLSEAKRAAGLIEGALDRDEFIFFISRDNDGAIPAV